MRSTHNIYRPLPENEGYPRESYLESEVILETDLECAGSNGTSGEVLSTAGADVAPNIGPQ